MAVEIANTSAAAGSSNFGKAVGASFGLGVADTAVGGLLGMASARLNYKYNKKLMAQQNQYNIEAFEREKQAVRDMAGLQKEGLRQAGYSTADPTNTGISQISPDAQGPSGSSMGVNLGSSNFGAALAQVAQAQNLEAQTNLANSQADLVQRQSNMYNQLTNAQIEEINARAEQARQSAKLSDQEYEQLEVMIPILQEKGFAEIYKIRAEARVMNRNLDLISKEIDKTIQETRTSKAQESANYASAESSRASAELSRQETEESKSRVAINEEEQKKRSAEAEKARYDAVWKKLEIVLRQHGVDINASQSKQRWQYMVNDLLTCEDENSVKRVFKRYLGSVLGAADYLIEDASSVLSGMIGYAAGSRKK